MVRKAAQDKHKHDDKFSGFDVDSAKENFAAAQKERDDAAHTLGEYLAYLGEKHGRVHAASIDGVDHLPVRVKGSSDDAPRFTLKKTGERESV